MNQTIKDTILESLRDSIIEAREFMEVCENNVFEGTTVATEELDAKDYLCWLNYRKNLLAAYKEIMKMEVEE